MCLAYNSTPVRPIGSSFNVASSTSSPSVPVVHSQGYLFAPYCAPCRRCSRAVHSFFVLLLVSLASCLLRKTHERLIAQSYSVEYFLGPLLDRPASRVILAGAGTSSFIGECLAPWLAARLPCRVEAIPTTDLVCAPYLYFAADAPTLLLSFGRSGNSPESVAAVDLANELVRDIHHLAITCNPEGALARA